MGEHQCQECGHITTGFEDQDFKLMREAEEAKDAEIARLRAALLALADRMELCGKESAGVFQYAAIHGCQYNGPNWVEELEAARAALKA